jgi:hypothetical protein
MNQTWSLILGGIVLIVLAYYLKGFFVINYVIGAIGIIFGIYNLIKKN